MLPAFGLVRWWPLGESRGVVLDPTRNFGRPIVSRHGVPTEVLAAAAKAAGSAEEVARWYEMPAAEIADAIEFERQLAASSGNRELGGVAPTAGCHSIPLLATKGWSVQVPPPTPNVCSIGAA